MVRGPIIGEGVEHGAPHPPVMEQVPIDLPVAANHRRLHRQRTLGAHLEEIGGRPRVGVFSVGDIGGYRRGGVDEGERRAEERSVQEQRVRAQLRAEPRDERRRPREVRRVDLRGARARQLRGRRPRPAPTNAKTT